MRPFPALVALVFLSGCNRGTPDPKVEQKMAANAPLPTGAPAREFTVYLVGFHPMLEDPSIQIEAHHYCNQKTPDFAQCVLFDSGKKDANLTGVEYIISEAMFSTLNEQDRKDWHPHNGEILSGQLRAPGVPQAAEHELMRTKMNSYGKTWHLWSPSQGQKLPTGVATLAWSFNSDGQVRPGLTDDLDQRLGTRTLDVRQSRQDLVNLAHPQSGVDRLKGAFDRPETPIPGVIDNGMK